MQWLELCAQKSANVCQLIAPMPDISPPLKLRNLFLTGLSLTVGLRMLARCTDFALLEDIRFSRCTNIESFLKSLASEISTLEQTALDRFEISLVEDETDWMEAVETFLQSSSGLEVLLISCNGPHLLCHRDLECHGDSLTHLHADFSNHWAGRWDYSLNVYTIEELQDLVTTCPRLQELGIGIFDYNAPVSPPLTSRNVLPSPKSNPEVMRFAEALVSLRIAGVSSSD